MGVMPAISDGSAALLRKVGASYPFQTVRQVFYFVLFGAMLLLTACSGESPQANGPWCATSTPGIAAGSRSDRKSGSAGMPRP
mgnify:CR=1 FL=1